MGLGPLSRRDKTIVASHGRIVQPRHPVLPEARSGVNCTQVQIGRCFTRVLLRLDEKFGNHRFRIRHRSRLHRVVGDRVENVADIAAAADRRAVLDLTDQIQAIVWIAGHRVDREDGQPVFPYPSAGFAVAIAILVDPLDVLTGNGHAQQTVFGVVAEGVVIEFRLARGEPGKRVFGNT